MVAVGPRPCYLGFWGVLLLMLLHVLNLLKGIGRTLQIPWVGGFDLGQKLTLRKSQGLLSTKVPPPTPTPGPVAASGHANVRTALPLWRQTPST